VGGGAVGGKWRDGCEEVGDRGWSMIVIEVATTEKQDERAIGG